MVDLKRTAGLILGGLTDPRATWERYLGDCPGWQQTMLTLTAPLVLASVLVGWFLSLLFGTLFYWGMGRATVVSLLLGLITALLAIALFGFLLSFIAGRLGGKADFDRGVAAVSLAAVPSYAGFALAGLPWLGWLLSLAGAITSLVFLYRIVPLSHAVPENRRVLHFVLTIVAAIVANLVIAALLGGARMGAGMDPGMSAPGGGIGSRLQEQAELVERMQAHRWDPPADGRVSEQQATALVAVLERARTLQEDHAEELQRLGEEMEGRDLSLRDIRRFGQGVDLAMGLQVAEMRAVDEHDGNWAEHRWVREQLMLAARGRGADEAAVDHNRELLERHREGLDAL